MPSQGAKQNTTEDQTAGNGEANTDAETQDGMEIVVTSALMSNSSSAEESGMEIDSATVIMTNSFLFIISISLAVVSV